MFVKLGIVFFFFIFSSVIRRKKIKPRKNGILIYALSDTVKPGNYDVNKFFLFLKIKYKKSRLYFISFTTKICNK